MHNKVNGPYTTSPQPRTVELDFVGGSNPIYIGIAAPGADLEQPVWSIRKLEYDGSNNLLSIKFAGGVADAAFVWASKEGYTYS